MKFSHPLNVFFFFIFCVLSCQVKTEQTEAKKDEGITPIKMVLDTSEIVRFNLDCSIRAIHAVDDETLWYAGSKSQVGYTEDGGKSWQIDSISYNGQYQLEFRSIFLTSKAVFVLSVGSPALLFKSEDKGQNWEIVYQENDSLAFYDAMAFWNDQKGIAMGDPTDGCLSIIKTMNGGANWTKISCSQIPASAEGEAAFAASNSNIALYENHAWIVSGGQKARVFHSADFGENWQVAETPIIQGGQMTGIFGCDFYDDKTGIVIGGDWNEQGMSRQNKAGTQDGGKTWKLLADGNAPSYRSCVQYIGKENPLQIIAVGIPGISFSSDGGHTWENISNESFYTVRRGGKTLWFAGKNKIAKLLIK